MSRRGTSNGNSSGNSYDRRARRAWLVETYRADQDHPITFHGYPVYNGVPIGTGVPACRCFRCGTLLTAETLIVDRIIPGCRGGTYKRSNIRPECADCSSKRGGAQRGGAQRGK